MYSNIQNYISAVAKTIKTTPKGSLLISVEVKPRYCQQALQMLGKPGTAIKITRDERQFLEDAMQDLDDNFGNY